VLVSRTVLLIAVLVAAMLLILAGCGGGASQPTQEEHDTHRGAAADFATVKLLLSGDRGVSGAATFTRADGGVRVKLNFRGLPKPHKSYLAHIHSGYCGTGDGHAHHGQEGEAANHHHGEDHEHGEHAREHSEEHGGAHQGHEPEGRTPEDIEYPLTPVRSDAEGRGSSTTVLKDLTIHKLYSGEAKYINVHAGGTGDPPDLACANIIKVH
jgi:hypothetical protein